MPFVDWHPFPEERPKKEGEFLVRVLDNPRIRVDYWMRFDGVWCWLSNRIVIAWAEY